MFTIFRRGPTQSASECALLLTIPLTRGEYEAAWHRGTDFLDAYAAACGVDDPEELWTRYEQYARLCSAAVNEAASSGVVVFRDVTLQTFVDSVQRFATVTIVAHSRGSEIETRDIESWSRVCCAVPDIATALQVPLPTTPLGRPSQLAAWLDAALGSRDAAAESPAADTRAAAWRAHLERERWRRRQMVEEICRGDLTGGPAVEFSDGLWSVATIDTALPLQIGTLDLTVCDSVLLAEVLRSRRADGIILANAHATTPDFRLILYRETVRLMARRRVSYQEAGLLLRRSLRRRAPLSAARLAADS